MKKIIFFLYFSCFFYSLFANDWVDVPYRNHLTTLEDFEEITVVNSDQDDSYWYGYALRRFSQQSNEKDADDWLILPGIYLEAGRAYMFEMMAMINHFFNTGLLEVKAGHSPDVDSLTIEIMEPTIILYCHPDPYDNRCFYVEESGVYYFGIHNISAVGTGVEIYEINVEWGIVPDSPDKVSNLTIEPDALGRRFATFNFNAPKKTKSGNLIPEDVMIDFEINEMYVASSFPGEHVEVQVEVERSDKYQFRVVPYIDEKPGPKRRIDGYVGSDYPDSPENFKVELLPEGMLFSWDPIDNRGPLGYPVYLEEVGYTVYALASQGFGYLGTEDDVDMHKTSFMFECDYNDWAGKYAFFVVASNDRGVAWSNFVRLDIDPSDLPAITNTPNTPCDLFDLSGRKSSALRPGLNIIRTERGAKKVMIP